MTDDPEAIEVARRLTPARRRAILGAAPGYRDDDSLDPSGRRMLYAMIDDGLFENIGHHPHHPRLSIFLTDKGRRVKEVLMQSTLQTRAGPKR